MGAGRRPARHRARGRRGGRRAVSHGIAHRSARPPPRGARVRAAGPDAARARTAGPDAARARTAGSHAGFIRPGSPPVGPPRGPGRHLTVRARRIRGVAARPAPAAGGTAPHCARYGTRRRPGRGRPGGPSGLVAGRAAAVLPAGAARTAGARAMAGRAAGVSAAAARAAGVPSVAAALAPVVVPTVAGHCVAVVPAVPRWAGGVLPAVAARAASPAGSVHAA
jgi:hypothetical protein